MATFNTSLQPTRPLLSRSSSSSHAKSNPRATFERSRSSASRVSLISPFRFNSLSCIPNRPSSKTSTVRAAFDSKRNSSSSSSEPRETILLPGCDYNHWLIVMEFPKDPAPTREQMIDTYLNTLATVVGSMEEAKKNMYAFSTTTYTGFQCTVTEETSEKFKGLPGVLWVLPDSYIDVKNKDYGGDKYNNGEITPCTYPTYQPNKRSGGKYERPKYERRRSGPPERKKYERPREDVAQSAATSDQSQ